MIGAKKDCVRCKGRGYCGLDFCPIHTKARALFRVKDLLKTKDFSGSAPTPFVGRYGYPHVNVGILSPPEIREDAWTFDAPRYWSDKGYNAEQLIDLRSSLINSRFKSDIKSSSSHLDIAREVGMASKPVEMEVNLEKKPVFRMNFENNMAPSGPIAKLKKMRITENPKIPYKVDKVVSDNDLKAAPALTYLYDKGIDENFLSQILSVGTVGIKPQRKLVPTRWSITATDDMIAKHLLNQVRQFNETDHCIYYGSYLGNHYLIMFIPNIWSYELFETYLPKALWNPTDDVQCMTDYEDHDGRKRYAEETAGGYYAARLGILEKLNSQKKQGSVLAMRFITGEYAVPLGVWVVREAARKALKSNPIFFDDLGSQIRYAKEFMKKRFNFDITCIVNKSRLIKRIKVQEKLTKYFR